MDLTFAEVPGQFSPIHLALLAGILLLNAGVYLLLRGRSEKTLLRLLFVLGAAMLLAEGWKQWFVARYVYPEGSSWFFPWQLCSISMYVCALLPLLRGRARDGVLVFLSTFSLLAALVALAVPGDMLRPQVPLFCHSFLYHAVMLAESCAAIRLLQKRRPWPAFRPALVLYLLTAAAAEGINVVSHTFFPELKPQANMFNITPYYPSTQPVFHEIALKLGILPEICIYLLLIALASWGLYLLQRRRRNRNLDGGR